MISALTTVFVVCFPVYLWFAGWEHPASLAAYLMAIGALRLAPRPLAAKSALEWFAALAPVALGAAVFYTGPSIGLYYPALVNLGLLALFLASLSAQRNFIQIIAEKTEQRALDAVGVAYTRNVTLVWCGFFLANILLSAYLAWNSMLMAWTIYNGAAAYAVIALLVLGERLLRQRVLGLMRKDSGA